MEDRMEKREQIIEWFLAPKSEMNSGAVLVGFILAGAGIYIIMKFGLFGGIIIAAGAVLAGVTINNHNTAQKRYEARVADTQMDEWLEEELKEVNKKALLKLGIDETECVAEPVCITGPRLWDTAGAKMLSRTGRDNIIRFTPVNVVVLNFGQHQLLSYECAFDFTTGNCLNESTDEYFYKDIVSVSTKTTSTEIIFEGESQKTQINSAETFVLATSGTSKIEVTLRSPKLAERMNLSGDIPTTRAEKAVQAVRKMLREKKSS